MWLRGHEIAITYTFPGPNILQALCGALFPRYSRLVLQRLLEVVQASPAAAAQTKMSYV